jgi:probable O-glycosylation ligase (exosortase A-associated)
MRDILVMSIILPWAMVGLRHPWIGVLLWVWVSLMNPHRFTYGFAYSAPVAMIAALATLSGWLFTREKESPFKGAPVAIFVVFTVWITISWLMGLDPSGQLQQWDKVMKVNLMVIITLMLMRTKQHIFLLVWVMTFSIALISAKGGVFTIANGGSYRVWGPAGSWVAGNNEFAVATIMAIPLLRFIQLQVSNAWLSRGITLIMLLCAASALGSHSRGGLLAIAAMTLLLWWRGTRKVRNGILLLLLGAALIGFMPENWTQRMDTIQTYEEDDSALGRLSAWWVSWHLGLTQLFGVGFSITKPELFLEHSPYGLRFGTPVAHSIWFQVMGHHGMIGFFLFAAIWVTTWVYAERLRRAAKGRPDLKWCGDLGGMAQVCVIGYAVGGSFLNLAYYDFPYYVMVLVVLTLQWVKRRGWESDPALARTRWRQIMGMVPSRDAPVPEPLSPVANPGLAAQSAGVRRRPPQRHSTS